MNYLDYRYKVKFEKEEYLIIDEYCKRKTLSGLFQRGIMNQ